MISLFNLSLTLGRKNIFNNATITFDKTKTALVARNGTGKTTLFNIINNELIPDKGNIIISKNSKIGYLKQEMEIPDKDIGIIDFILDNIIFFKEYNDLLNLIENTYSPDKKLLNKLLHAEDTYRLNNGFLLKEKCKDILLNLGFKENINKKIYELSYGYKMRTMIAKILLEDNDVLLLDEPTNHLDLPSIKFIEGYLKNLKKLIIIVSHDRYFLDNICENTVEIYNRKFYKYKGNYSFYKKEKKIRLDQELKEYENLLIEKNELKKFINKWKAKESKTSMAKSREKVLKKVEEKIAEFDFIKEKDVKFYSKNLGLKSKIAIKCKINYKKYDELTVLRNVDIMINPGQKIFLIGQNGIGKSTLVKIIAGEDGNYSGNVEYNEKLKLLFFDFDKISKMPMATTVYQFIAKDGLSEFEIRSLLGIMLFSDDDYDKQIGVLSGGEKVRLYIAKLFVEDFNFLILDEPTNYLDIETIDILVNWLKKLKMGFIIVSHNEYLLSAVDNAILWYIENAKLHIYYGNYNEYAKYNNNIYKENNFETKKQIKEKNTKDKKTERQKIINKRIEINKKIKKLDNIIFDFEKEKDGLLEQLNNSKIYREQDKIKEMNKRLKFIENNLKRYYNEWEKLIEEIPELGDR